MAEDKAKRLARFKRYNASEKGRAARRRYAQTLKGVQCYQRNNDRRALEQATNRMREAGFSVQEQPQG